jgi:thiamine biosynthesis lipoprotein
MGTEVSLVAITSREKGVTDVELAFEQAWKEVERLEGLLTSWTAESDVGRVNQGSAQWVSVASETAFVVERSLLSSRLSQGAFDISFHTLGELWRFGDAQELNPRVPTPSQVAQARKLIDYRKVEVELQPPRVRIGREMRIDLGGIAKGYIVDQIVKVLRDRGLGSFLVQAGGDLYGAGRKPDGSAWVSGVRDPRGPRDRSFAVIDLTDHAFSTAGDYARAYVLNGKRYHHIIDPRTGYPATESRSVTIWAPDALTADAIDDAVFILGPVAGLKLVESLPGVGALIVDKNNKVWVSERLQGKIKMVAEPTPGL